MPNWWRIDFSLRMPLDTCNAALHTVARKENYMVFVPNGRGGGWHEPPYTKEEEEEFYRRVGNGPVTIVKGPHRPTPAGSPPTRKAT